VRGRALAEAHGVDAARAGDDRETRDDRRVLAPSKVNIGPKPPALAYRLAEAPNGSVRVVWEGESSLTAEQLLAAPTDEEERGVIVEAYEFLTDFLAAGPMATKTVIVEARTAGIAERTLRRAAKRRGVRHRKLSMGGGWIWELPAEGGQAHGKMANPGEWPPSTDVGRLQATDKAGAPETEDMGVLI
jgi:putative DNA primase/helicase